MIRRKSPEADLKRTYGKVLLRAIGLSALLHLGLFVLNPHFEFKTVPHARKPTVVEIESVPQTRQSLPHSFLSPVRIAAIPADTLPRRHLGPDRPEPIAQFALEEEEEAVDFWMLEKRPLVQKRVLPQYPDSARQALVEGRIYVRLLLDQTGHVERIAQITGPEIFHRVAAEAARQWEFTPAVQNDRPVKVWISLPFTFELE